RPVCGVIDSCCSTFDSRRMPSGVISYTQANTSAGTNPIASSTTIERGSQFGASNIGSNVPATCVISHAATRYRPAMRMTLRRVSSANRLRVMSSPAPENRRRSSVGDIDGFAHPSSRLRHRKFLLHHDHAGDALQPALDRDALVVGTFQQSIERRGHFL